ncbi:MAG: hypothetical protein OIF50_12220 [Flavobacteriaceae bacterium]|nr:hypothetical protein [Flavobacteriaceae bacterium]
MRPILTLLLYLFLFSSCGLDGTSIYDLYAETIHEFTTIAEGDIARTSQEEIHRATIIDSTEQWYRFQSKLSRHQVNNKIKAAKIDFDQFSLIAVFSDVTVKNCRKINIEKAYTLNKVIHIETKEILGDTPYDSRPYHMVLIHKIKYPVTFIHK